MYNSYIGGSITHFFNSFLPDHHDRPISNAFQQFDSVYPDLKQSQRLGRIFLVKIEQLTVHHGVNNPKMIYNSFFLNNYIHESKTSTEVGTHAWQGRHN